jgi:hypothetical protein
MRFALIVLTMLIGVVASPIATAGAQPPAMPDLRGYTTVSTYPFAMGNEVYFQTPDGLLCAIQPDRGAAGCDGRLPGTPGEVNEIVLAADVGSRGLRATANHAFVKSTGDFECAVGGGSFTACTKGEPATQWMVVSPNGTGIGPATEGLPPNFPDPNEYIVGDDSYIVGEGPKNMFPFFTVDGGLTCSIVVYSGGEIGCDGPLPGVRGGQNEVFATIPGGAGIRRTDASKFKKPAYPGTIRQLPVGYRVQGVGSICMATAGGVACIGTLADAVQGFQVTPTGVTTFGG